MNVCCHPCLRPLEQRRLAADWLQKTPLERWVQELVEEEGPTKWGEEFRCSMAAVDIRLVTPEDETGG